MANKSKWQINSYSSINSTIWFWKITNLISGQIHFFPVEQTTISMEVSSNTDYNFIFRKYELNELQLNIIDVKYIGNSGTPAYNSSSTDLASILALI